MTLTLAGLALTLAAGGTATADEKPAPRVLWGLKWDKCRAGANPEWVQIESTAKREGISLDGTGETFCFKVDPNRGGSVLPNGLEALEGVYHVWGDNSHDITVVWSAGPGEAPKRTNIKFNGRTGIGPEALLKLIVLTPHQARVDIDNHYKQLPEDAKKRLGAVRGTKLAPTKLAETWRQNYEHGYLEWSPNGVTVKLPEPDENDMFHDGTDANNPFPDDKSAP